jgi:hypothetical protein
VRARRKKYNLKVNKLRRPKAALTQIPTKSAGADQAVDASRASSGPHMRWWFSHTAAIWPWRVAAMPSSQKFLGQRLRGGATNRRNCHSLNSDYVGGSLTQ